MTGEQIILVTAMALAFIIGFAAWRASICSVIAAYDVVQRGNVSRLKAFLIAAATAGAIGIPVAWATPDRAVLAPHFVVTIWVVLGGVLYGLGAWINGGCAFGTLIRIASGETALFAMLPGVVAGYWMAAQFPELSPQVTAQIFHLAIASPAAVLAWAVLAGLAWLGIWQSLRHRKFGVRRLLLWLRLKRWRPVGAMVLAGVAGGVLFVIAGAWTYTAMLKRTAVYFKTGELVLPFEALMGCLALLAGAVAAAVFVGGFRLCAPAPVQMLRSLVGGVAIGFGASLIPGGNDTLVLFALPGLAPNAIVAYAAMFFTLIGLAWVHNLFLRGR